MGVGNVCCCVRGVARSTEGRAETGPTAAPVRWVGRSRQEAPCRCYARCSARVVQIAGRVGTGLAILLTWSARLELALRCVDARKGAGVWQPYYLACLTIVVVAVLQCVKRRWVSPCERVVLDVVSSCVGEKLLGEKLLGEKLEIV